MQLPLNSMHKKETPFFDEKFTFIYGFIDFSTLEYCFEKLISLSKKLIPWLTFEQINAHPELIEQINIIKEQCKGSGVRYEIYPYNQKLNKLSAIESFTIVFFLGIIFTLVVSSVVPHLISNNFLSSIIVVCTFIICILTAFTFAMYSASIRFALQEYRSKNYCYLITPSRIYHISREWDFFGKKITTVDTQCFSIKGVWHPSSRIPESYKYCKIKAAIVKIYVDEVDYVEEIKSLERLAIKNPNFQYQSVIQRFPNDFGRETAPFYMYLVESYDEVRDNLRTWSEKLR
jgi:hypothetical protein